MLEPILAIHTFAACPGCKTVISNLLHDFSLCSQLKNAEYRIRELEKRLDAIVKG